MKLAVVTPSYIDSKERFEFAEKSLDSLQDAIGTIYPNIVVDDTPRGFWPRRLIKPANPWVQKAKELYSGKNITFIQRFGSGSASAILLAIREARNQGCSLAFIHLDDHVYIPIFRDLVSNALSAFDKDEELSMIRMSGYPIIHENYEPLVVRDNKINFDSIELNRQDNDSYTLWWTFFQHQSIEQNYWPIALWFCIYRIDFLEKLLTFDQVPGLKNLCHVEKYYKNKDNWEKFLQSVSGKFGYTNMQFGGLEMHRTEDWEELIKLPNTAIR